MADFQRSKNPANVSKIIGIQFSIMSPEEIVKGSVAEITNRETCQQQTRNWWVV
jgi:DNA-directed RNA polymerase beta' subunit